VNNKGGTTKAKLIIDDKIPISLDIRFGERKHRKSDNFQGVMYVARHSNNLSIST
jgi:hypothetical protein